MAVLKSQEGQGASAAAVANRLHSAAIHLLRRLRTEDRRAGVGPAQLSALSVLVFAGPQTLSRLAGIEQVRKPTMTRIVAGLVRQGLARRSADAHDRRAVIVRATPRGRRLLQRARRRRIGVLADRLRRLSVAERGNLNQAAGLVESLFGRPVTGPGG